MPTSEVIQQGHTGQDAVSGLKGRIAPTSLLNGHATRSCVHGVQLRGTRLHQPLKGAQPGRADTSGGATPANLNGTSSTAGRNGTSSHSQAGSGLHPMCQPMPVQMLVHLMDTLTSHRPPAQDSRAILTALNDYIGDVISQPGPPAVVENRDHFDSTSDFPVFPAKPVMPPSTNGASSGVQAHSPSAAPAQKAAASSGESVVDTEMKRTAVAGATATATSPDSTAVADAAVAGVASAHSSTATLQEHILRWSADLGILQALHANGYTETEVENFVNKLLPGLADGVTSQLSQAGFPLASANAATPATPTPAAPVAAAIPPSAAAATSAVPAPAAKTRSAPPQSPPPNGRSTAPAGDPFAKAADTASPTSSQHATQPAAAVQPGVLLTDKVSPFIQHPYHLLQQLHESARKRASSGDSPSVAAATGAGILDQPGHEFSKLGAGVPNGLFPLSHAAPGVHTPTTAALSNLNITPAAEPASVSAPQQPSSAHVETAAVDNVTATNIPDASETGESTSTRSTSEALPAAQAQALATVCSMGSSSPEGSAAGSGAASSAGPIGWKSVLEKLILAGPQSVQPASPYVPGSYGWGSGNSSTEHDTFSAKSEDAPPADGGAGNTSSGSAGGNTSATSTATGGSGSAKAKKRRNKRAKNSGRSCS